MLPTFTGICAAHWDRPADQLLTDTCCNFSNVSDNVVGVCADAISVRATKRPSHA